MSTQRIYDLWEVIQSNALRAEYLASTLRQTADLFVKEENLDDVSAGINEMHLRLRTLMGAIGGYQAECVNFSLQQALSESRLAEKH